MECSTKFSSCYYSTPSSAIDTTIFLNLLQNTPGILDAELDQLDQFG